MKGTTMKHIKLILIGLFLLIFPTLSVAQSFDIPEGTEIMPMQKPVLCGKPGHLLIKSLHENYQENIVAIGSGSVKDEDRTSQVIIMWNDLTKTYSIGELLPNGLLCLLVSGDKFEFAGKYEPIEKSKPIPPKGTQEANPKSGKASPMSHRIVFLSKKSLK